MNNPGNRIQTKNDHIFKEMLVEVKEMTMVMMMILILMGIQNQRSSTSSFNMITKWENMKMKALKVFKGDLIFYDS
jgi:hypothetical protein